MKFYTLLTISIIVLIFSVCCKTVIEKYSFKTNSSKNLDYRSADILDIDSGNGKYRNYVPQGFSITNNYIYFSAYHKFETCDKSEGYDETKPSRVFKVDRSTKKLVKVYTLVDQSIGSHVGGMSVIEETNQFFIASRRNGAEGTGKNGISLYNMDGVGSNLDVDVTAHMGYYYGTYAITECLGSYAPSYMYWDKSRMLLWYGRFNDGSGSDDDGSGSICANRVSIKSGSASLSKIVVHNKELPYLKVQGLAVVPGTDQDGTNAVVYLSVSYGFSKSNNNSKIYKWNLSTDSKIKVAEGWPGLQNLDYDPKTGKLWGITEAGSKYYQERKEKCGGGAPWGSHPGYIYAEIDV